MSKINDTEVQVRAAIDEAFMRGKAMGTQDAVNKARAMMPTILANAHKQGVKAAAGFLKAEVSDVIRGMYGCFETPDPTLRAFERQIRDLFESGEVPEAPVAERYDKNWGVSTIKDWRTGEVVGIEAGRMMSDGPDKHGGL